MSFDEELLRQTFYQTLQPIYVTNTNAGNTRGDILSLVNAGMVVAPMALTIPIGTLGKPDSRVGYVGASDRVCPFQRP